MFYEKLPEILLKPKRKQIKVTKTKVHDLLGASRFHSELAERSTEPGVVTGLSMDSCRRYFIY